MRRQRDEERVARICDALRAENLDALVCTLPSNVLLLSGYWPVIGSAIAIATRDGEIAVAAPEDENELAANSWAGVLRTFQAGSLENLRTMVEVAVEAVEDLVAPLGLRSGLKLGWEGSSSFHPGGYASTLLYGASAHFI